MLLNHLYYSTLNPLNPKGLLNFVYFFFNDINYLLTT